MVQKDRWITQGTGRDVNSLPLQQEGPAALVGVGCAGSFRGFSGRQVSKRKKAFLLLSWERVGRYQKTKDKQKIKTFNFQVNKKSV